MKLISNVNLIKEFKTSMYSCCYIWYSTGIQYAGSHLKELQRAFKNPAANLGIIFSEAGKRAFRSVGLGSSPSLAEHVHPNLSSSAALVGKV
jgi:very long chain acyl-CoA dehydrogenase